MTETDVERDLIQRLLSRGRSKEAAYAELVDTYHDRIYWHVRRMVHRHEDADDIVQNTFVKIWKGLANFKGKSGLFTWVYRIASNEAISYLRKHNKHHIGIADTGERVVQMASDPYFDGDAAQALLKAAIADLPDRQRAVFVMRYYEGLPYKDIATIFDVSVGSLKASYHHAVIKIKDYINTYGLT